MLMNQLLIQGYEVIVAPNGEEILSCINEQQFDLLILDIILPKLSGYEVCKKIRLKYSLIELPILMLTANSQLQDKITLFEMGANDYLEKPFGRQELLARVKTLICLGRLNSEFTKINLLVERKVKERTSALEDANLTLTKMNNKLQHMAESRRYLLSNISHELRTPITLIYGYVQAVQQGIISADETRYLEMVASKVRLLDCLIDELSDLSKLEDENTNLTLADISLDLCIEQIYNKFGVDMSQTGRQLILPEFNANTFKPFICSVDIDRIDQLFTNLIWDAIKRTSLLDGIITIRADVSKDRSEVIFQINDNGNSISENESFSTEWDGTVLNRSNTNGNTISALGLRIVKEIVRGHNGRVWVDSKMNVGSTFFIALPIRYKN